MLAPACPSTPECLGSLGLASCREVDGMCMIWARTCLACHATNHASSFFKAAASHVEACWKRVCEGQQDVTTLRGASLSGNGLCFVRTSSKLLGRRCSCVLDSNCLCMLLANPWGDSFPKPRAVSPRVQLLLCTSTLTGSFKTRRAITHLPTQPSTKTRTVHSVNRI